MAKEIKRNFYIPKFGATVSIIAKKDGSKIEAMVNHEKFDKSPHMEFYPKKSAAWNETSERISDFVKEVCKEKFYG